MSEVFVAQVSRWRVAVLVLLGWGFVALGTAIVRHAPDDWFAQAIGWVSILFFGACAIVGTRQLFRSGAVMRVDAQGIWWSRWSDTVIPWTAIDHAEVRSMHRQQFLCLWLHEPDRYRSTRTTGRLARANEALGFGHVALSTIGTDRRLSELVAALRAFAPQLAGALPPDRD